MGPFRDLGHFYTWLKTVLKKKIAANLTLAFKRNCTICLPWIPCFIHESANSERNTMFTDKILSRCASVSWPGSIVSLIDQLYRSQTERTQVQEGILRYPLTVRWTSLFNGVSMSFCKIHVWSCIIIGLFHIKTANCPLFVKSCAVFFIQNWVRSCAEQSWGAIEVHQDSTGTATKISLLNVNVLFFQSWRTCKIYWCHKNKPA